MSRVQESARKAITSIMLCLLFFSAGRGVAISQQAADSSIVDVHAITLYKNINRFSDFAFTQDNKTSLVNVYSSLQFKKGVPFKDKIPNSYITRKLIVRFRVNNSSDSITSVCFLPGFFYDEISLYKLTDNQLRLLPRLLPTVKDSIGYPMIAVEPGDTATIIAELRFLKTYVNSIRPRLINPGYVPAFTAGLSRLAEEDGMATYIFCGLLLMMILFSAANFLQGGNREFLYYSLYALFLGSMLLTKAIFFLTATRTSYFIESYLDFILQGAGIIFYMLFMQRFLATKTQHRFLYRLYNAGIIVLIASMAAFTFFHYFTDNFSAENLIENASKIFLLAMIIVFLVYSARHWRDVLLRYLFWGNMLLFLFSLLSQLAVMKTGWFQHLNGILGSSLFYYEAGLFFELVFFLAGLNYKNRRRIIAQTKERESLKAQALLQEYEKEIAVYKAQQEERQRISADMHDELGSGMTAIRLMSEIARNKMKENTPVEIEKISRSADDVLNKMNAIIWSMNSSNDKLDNLISYIRVWAIEYFENTPVECTVTTPETIPDQELSGDKRRNIFLCVKETLNNVLKHSEASAVTISISAGDQLIIRISDNGRGIDLEKLRQFGNGLKNIKHRMESIGGNFVIENNKGTITTLTLLL